MSHDAVLWCCISVDCCMLSYENRLGPSSSWIVVVTGVISGITKSLPNNARNTRKAQGKVCSMLPSCQLYAQVHPPHYQLQTLQMVRSRTLIAAQQASRSPLDCFYSSLRKRICLPTATTVLYPNRPTTAADAHSVAKKMDTANPRPVLLSDMAQARFLMTRARLQAPQRAPRAAPQSVALPSKMFRRL